MEEIKEGYTRVSDIIKIGSDLSHIPAHILENKCRIGSNVHDTIAAMIESIYIDSDEDAKGYIKSWELWNTHNNDHIEYIETEKRFYCDDLMITGCVDAIAEIGDYRFILDYKTSAQPDLKKWALQGCFYNYLAKKNGYETDDHVFFLHLKKDGSYPKEIEVFCNEELWEDALHFYEVFRILNLT